MAADGTIVIDVTLDDGSVVQGLGRINNQLGNAGQQGTTAFGKIGAGIKTAGLAAVGLVAGIGGIALAVGGLAAPLVRAAGDLQALNAQFDTVFKGMEATATEALDTIGAETGVATGRLKGTFVQMAAFAKTSGADTATALDITSRATLAAADSAAFYDRSIEDVSENLQSFLKGNYENDAALGISATETTRNAAAMDEFGSKFKDLTEIQKQQTLLKMVEDGNKLGGAMGQAARETDGLENVIGNLKDAWETLKATLGENILPIAVDGIKALTEAINNFDVTPFIKTFEKVKEVLTTVFKTVMPIIKEQISGLKELWASEGEEILATVTEKFNAVKNVIEQVLNAVVPFVQDQVSKIVAFWKSDGEQILAAVKNAFEGVKAIIDFVMPAIKFVIEYVWEAIKNVITGALDVIMGAVKIFSGLFTGDFSKMWEGIKQVFKGAIDLILGLMSLSFIGGIRTAIVNFGKTAINLFKNNWTSIINGVKSFVTNFGSNISGLVTKVIGFFKNMYTNTANTIMQMSINIVGRISTMATGMLNAIKGLPDSFLQFGKDIVNGLIKGITGNVDKAVEAIKGVGSAIKDKFMDVLNMHSPSRVFKEYGRFTVEGYQKGVSDNSDIATGAIVDLGKKIVSIGKENSKEEQKLLKESAKKVLEIQKDADAKLANLTTSKMVKKKKVIIDNSKAIAKIEADEAKKLAAEQQRLEKATMAITTDIQKQKLDAIKLYVEDKKSLEDLSIKDEIALWATATNSFKVGTKERVEAQKQYAAAIDSVNSELVSVNEKYTKAMTDINNDYITNEKKITDVYEKAVEDKEKALFNFMNLFDEFDIKIEKSGEELLANLKSQTDGFKRWEIEINKLSEKAIDKGLIKELTDMGPKALSELRALNSLTDTQLTEYSDTYAEKAKLAKDRALVETAALKTDTDLQLDELKKSTTLKLSELEDSWVKEIKGVTQATANEFKSLESIGADAVRGLVDGMNSMHKDLEEAAKSLADTVTKTTKKTLDIHSPSRVMRYEVGQMIGEGLALGIEDNEVLVGNAALSLGEGVVGSFESKFKEIPSIIEKYGKTAFKSLTNVNMALDKAFNYGDAYGVEMMQILKQALSMDTFSENERVELMKRYEDEVYLAGFRIVKLEEETKNKILNIEEEKNLKRLEVINNYEKEVKKRTSEIVKQYGLLDKIEIKSIVADDFSNSLESQIESMKLYTESIKSLSTRGLDSALLEEISSLGVKMAGEVASFSNLTDDELEKYVSLWREKNELARSVAESELVGMKEDMIYQLEQIDIETGKQLDNYLENYNTLYESIHGTTDVNMNKLRSDMVEDGSNAMQGLIDGMEIMKGGVISKAQEIATAIKSTIQNSLDIHSPSRWMRDFVVGNLAKGFDRGVNKNSSLFVNGSNKIADLMKSELVNPLRGVKLDVGNLSSGNASSLSSSTSNNINNARTINAPVTVYGNNNDEEVISREIRKMSFMYGV